MNNRLPSSLYKKLTDELALLFSSFVISLLVVLLLLPAVNSLDAFSSSILPAAVIVALLTFVLSVFVLVRKARTADGRYDERLEEILQLEEIEKIELSRKRYQRSHSQVEIVLETLPKHEAQILRMSLFRNYSVSQIAEKLHRPEHKVRSDLIGAFRKMEVLLQGKSNSSQYGLRVQRGAKPRRRRR